MKRQLVINTLSFEVHTEVYDEYGDTESVYRQLELDRKSRVLSMTDFYADSERKSVTLEGRQMTKLHFQMIFLQGIFLMKKNRQK